MEENKRKHKGKAKVSFIAVVVALSLTLLALLPFIIMATVSLALPAVYNDTFLGELSEKYELLGSIDEPKIIVVGGSSVAFGLNSRMIEDELGMRVVNFGLYASLGTKLMMDLSRSNINEGDIVILAPELSDQTLSLYFNAESAMQALDGNFAMIKDIDSDDYAALLGELWNFSSEKLSYLVSGELPVTDGAYSKEWFNENGDSEYDRPYNIMASTEKSITLDYIYDKSDGADSEYEKFIDYVRDYSDFCTSRGAKVFFSFSPMNEIALTDYNTKANIYAFYDNLSSALGKNCAVISNINDYIMNEGYFFDSEFHLNNSGVTVRTVRLIDDIKRQMGRTDVTMSAEALPKPSGYAMMDFVAGDEENLYFILEKARSLSGQEGYKVVGLNEEGLKQNQLMIPNNVYSLPIIGIDRNAFEGSEVRRVYLSKNIKTISSGAFGGATHLCEVYISHTGPSEISIPNSSNDSGLATDGACIDILIYVPQDALTDFKTDYFWGDYSFCLRGY